MAAPRPTGTAIARARTVVEIVPAIRARAPKLGGLSPPGAGIQRELEQKCIQSSRGSIGRASLKMDRKTAVTARMPLQPHRRIVHSVGFSIASRKLNLRRGRGDSNFSIFAGGRVDPFAPWMRPRLKSQGQPYH